MGMTGKVDFEVVSQSRRQKILHLLHNRFRIQKRASENASCRIRVSSHDYIILASVMIADCKPVAQHSIISRLAGIMSTTL